ncbi:MAG TPA: class I adenylate-forming enzyme family protein [Flavilitoribacter sp.]|nr:class I adenylate-forming enzyme family protein [Flavilitoribacter sp.]HMQ90019.1 class I adenylate-forming enzyme family protein [Flavilitoribacter sp.]
MNVPRLPFLWDYLSHWAGQMPEEVALVYDGVSRTYNELFRSVDDMTRSLQALGIRKGDRIVTILPARPEFLIVFLAAARVGAVTLPMDVRYKSGDLERLLPQAAPRLIIAMAATAGNEDIAGQVNGLKCGIREPDCYFIGKTAFGRDYQELATIAARVEIKDIEPFSEDDPALIVFTGGSTGRPKAAVLSHRNVTQMAYFEEGFIRRELNRAGFEGRISTLAALPPSHVGGTVECMGMGLVGGHKLFFLDHWRPDTVFETTIRNKIPWVGAVPSMYAILLSYLADHPAPEPSGIYLAVFSGEPVTLEMLGRIRRSICPRVINGYGSTEAGAEVTFTTPEDLPEALADGYVGRPLPTVKIKIADEEGRELPAGKTGEILVKSDFTIAGYFNMPEEDNAGFTPDGFCRTGDLGYLTTDGGLCLQGRKKQIIRVGGYTVLPVEVEESAMEFPGIAAAAAVGRPDPMYGEVVWLHVAPAEHVDLDAARLLAYLKTRLADYKVPRRIILREALPATHIGKVDRSALIRDN